MKFKVFFLKTEITDEIVWGHSKDGSYTARSVFRWLIQARQPTVALMGRGPWVWALKLPENVKHFLWLTDHQCLPTNLFRTNIHISTDASYCRCGGSQ